MHGRPKASILLTRYPPGKEGWCSLTVYYEFIFFNFLVPFPSLFILVKDAEDDELSVQKNHLALVKELQKENPERKLYCPLLFDLTQAKELGCCF